MRHTFTLANGVEIPAVGFGTYKAADNTDEAIISEAIRQGYRHLDTAAFYFNEEAVGKAVRESGIPREEFFLTSKGKRLCIRVVRPAREACISCKKLRENELRRTAFGCKWHNGNIGKVIGDVLTVDGDDTVERLRDAVNTECLVGGGVIGFCLDDALLGD